MKVRSMGLEAKGGLIIERVQLQVLEHHQIVTRLVSRQSMDTQPELEWVDRGGDEIRMRLADSTRASWSREMARTTGSPISR